MFALISFVLPNRIDDCLNFHRRKFSTPFERDA